MDSTTNASVKQEFKSESDEERRRDASIRKKKFKKSLKEAYNVPLTLVSPRESLNYREDRIINLDVGDPIMYEKFWKKMGKKATIVIPGWRYMSYLSGGQSLCWFLEPDLCQQILRLHRVVGNAITEGRYIVVGTGSSQLILAALYALSSPNSSQPTNVVSAIPYYSSYPSMSDDLKTSVFKWGGDATTYEKDEPYIEIVTSPNNPDGSLREPVVNRTGGKVCEQAGSSEYPESFYGFGHRLMTERWSPFAWLKCEDEEEDSAALLQRHRIIGRSGVSFGSEANFVRVSMMDRDDNFDSFVQRISKITRLSED
ncbi:Tryptophan aminotransferase-related protein 2 [Cucurbita argyrosperma subsp. argyrosperma]|nr:Tryptophan aminotransferase-related protein 2 [Cucurbita argyrosperma subsp. argyrosperma]